MDCVMCKIIEGEIPAEKVYEDVHIMAFKDINPVAPTHVLVIPRKHIEKITDLTSEDAQLMGHMMTKIPKIIKDLGIEDKGVRIVNNCNEEAGQSVFHIHFHILGGRTFSWPPG